MNPEKGKEGALYYVICDAGIRNALLELTIKNPEKKGEGVTLLRYLRCRNTEPLSKFTVKNPRKKELLVRFCRIY